MHEFKIFDEPAPKRVERRLQGRAMRARCGLLLLLAAARGFVHTATYRRSSALLAEAGWRYAVEECDVSDGADECRAQLGEPVVVGGHLVKILEEIWNSQNKYTPTKPIRPRHIEVSGNTMREDPSSLLAKLNELRTKGVIDDEEFSIAKAKVMNLPTNCDSDEDCEV